MFRVHGAEGALPVFELGSSSEPGGGGSLDAVFLKEDDVGVLLESWRLISIGRRDVSRSQLELERSFRARVARFPNSAVKFGRLPPARVD